MYDALNDAIKQLNDLEIASQPGRDKKIIIIQVLNRINGKWFNKFIITNTSLCLTTR